MKNISLFIFTLLVFTGCETIDLDQTRDPSTKSKEFADPIFAFNYVQLELADFVESNNNFTQRVTRQMAMTSGDTYENSFLPGSFNRNWITGYGILNQIKLLQPRATIENKKFIIGASSIVKAYVLATLVDTYGDVPYSEALRDDIIEPKFDSGASVYKVALQELDNGIGLLSQGNVGQGDADITDLFYNKNKLRWITLAKTLKLKLYISAQNVGADIGVNIPVAIQDIFTANDIIDTPQEDFAFRYGSNRNVPNSRHPMYNDQYELGGGAYIGNYFIWAMTVEKSGPPIPASGGNPLIPIRNADFDPRTGFYFYKQASIQSSAALVDIPGRTRPTHYNNTEYNSFFDPSIRTCYTVSNWTSGAVLAAGGYLGRDHGNNTGLPPDAFIRAVAGVYPVGGSFGGLFLSTISPVQKSGTSGALGAGITPIVMSSFVQFWKAEAILKLGVTGDAKLVLKDAIEKSIDRVVTPVNGFPNLVANDVTGIASRKLAYTNFISAKYDLSSANEKLELVIKEFYLAAWGNGIECYNNYRRTGYPRNFQPTLELNSGDYFYSALYPDNSTGTNVNCPNKTRSVKVFWDKNSFILN